MKDKKCIIWANGHTPAKSLVLKLFNRGYSVLFCADGGANAAKKAGIVPDYIIGDFDSVEKETLNYFSGKSEIIEQKRQSDTDIEKTLKIALKMKFTEAVILGGGGNRLDHTIGNVSIMLKYSGKIRIYMIHGNSAASVYSGKNKFNTFKGETISLFGFDGRTKFKSTGLKYPLRNISLKFGEREGSSNQAVGDSVEVTVTGGKGLIIRSLESFLNDG